ncbi:hypothetical protein HMN09_01242400 [Mycena chlorophos]|uniref:Uncharacterized protein n=1 Tax=Mycena chlorophos TaxID=658473 RepID=A0A8H6S4T7_MYCCL|nr:hypothetical protein HMN09_01242400 [Mycena chlorophos]
MGVFDLALFSSSSPRDDLAFCLRLRIKNLVTGAREAANCAATQPIALHAMITLPLNIAHGPEPPRTPVQLPRVPRVPLAPNNIAPRRHRLPVLLPKQEPGIAISPLAQADARIIHARLRNNHERLQVHLHGPTAPSQPSHPPATANSITAFLNNVLQTYAARFNREVQQVHAVCTRLVTTEQAKLSEERDQLVRERDEARLEADKLRVLLDRRKRSRAILEEDADDSAISGLDLQYPASPQSPPQRLLSPFVLALDRSRSSSPDGTQFDVTVLCDRLSSSSSRPAKRRRLARSSSSLDPETVVRPTHPPCNTSAGDGDGECDMDLETDVESDTTDSSCAASSSAPTVNLPAPIPLRRIAPLPTRSAPRIGPGHLDIMYWATQGKLICRACVLTPTPSPEPDSNGSPPRAPVHAFAPDASWELLRSHCEEMHPTACADVARLDADCLRELRRRLAAVPRDSVTTRA